MIRKLRTKLDDPQWREAIFLAFGYHISVQGECDIPVAVIDELLANEPQNTHEWTCAILLCETYVRLLGPQRASEAQLEQSASSVMAAAPILLTQAMQSPDLPPPQRLEVGLLAAALDIDPEDLDDFLPLEGWFSSPDGDHFRMARYPVTNKQFRHFMNAGGYETERFWSTEGRRRRNQEKWAVLRDNPFQFPPPYEKLVGDLSGSYSRRINIQHRLVYQVLEEVRTVKVIRMWSHYE